MAKGKVYAKRGTTSMKSGKSFKTGKKKYGKKSKYGTSYKKIEYTQPEVKALQNYGIKVIRPVPIYATTHRNQYKVEQQTVLENGQRTCLMKTWNCEPLRFDLDLIQQGVMDGQRIGNKIFVRWLTLNMKIKCAPEYNAGFIKFLVLRNKQATMDFYSSDHINQTKSLAYLDYGKYRVEEEIIIPIKSDVRQVDEENAQLNQNKALVPTVHVLERKWKVMSAIEYGPTGSVSNTGRTWTSSEKRDQRYSLAEAKELLAGSANGSLSIPTIFFGNMQELSTGLISANSAGIKTETEYIAEKKQKQEFDKLVQAFSTFAQLPGDHLQKKINDGITISNFRCRLDAHPDQPQPGLNFGDYTFMPQWTHVRLQRAEQPAINIPRHSITAYMCIAAANISQNFVRAPEVGGFAYLNDGHNNYGSMFGNTLTNGFGVGTLLENNADQIPNIGRLLFWNDQLNAEQTLHRINHMPTLEGIDMLQEVHWFLTNELVGNWQNLNCYGTMEGDVFIPLPAQTATLIRANIESWSIDSTMYDTFAELALQDGMNNDQFIGSLSQVHGNICTHERDFFGNLNENPQQPNSYTAHVGHFSIKIGGIAGLMDNDPFLQDGNLNHFEYEAGLSVNNVLVEARIPPLQDNINRFLNHLKNSVVNYENVNSALVEASNYLEYVALISQDNQQIREATNTIMLADGQKESFDKAVVSVEYAWNVSYTDT